MTTRNAHTVRTGEDEREIRQGLRDRHILVTGACGFFGRALILRLLELGVASVHAFDVRRSDLLSRDPRVLFFGGDIRCVEDLQKAAEGCDCVFHIASFGMSGREMLQKKLILDVNVQGTAHVLRVCRDSGIKRLVYTSTTNVIFCGRPIHGGDESLPYADVQDMVDPYSQTKRIAEDMVLKANNGDSLRTCALRPAGIYGEGEERHFPRAMALAKKGLYQFTVGDPDTLVEFVHVDNLVHAHILAAVGLRKGAAVCGQPYFISDCHPVNNFVLFTAAANALGHPTPRLNLPVWLMYMVAVIIEFLHWMLSSVVDFQPLLTRAEVLKVGVTHFFDPRKPREELGYYPIVSFEEGKARLVRYFSGPGGDPFRRSPQQNSLAAFIWELSSVLILVALPFATAALFSG